MGVSKNWAKEEKRLRIEGVCSVACREKETTQLMGEQMGREAGPNLEPPPPGFCQGSWLPVSPTPRLWLSPFLTHVPHTYTL